MPECDILPQYDVTIIPSLLSLGPNQIAEHGCAHASSTWGFPCMSIIPGHPCDLGTDWDLALSHGIPDWDALFEGYIAAVD